MRLPLLFSAVFFALSIAESAQSSLLGASLAFQNAFVDILPTKALPAVLTDLTPRLIVYVQTFTDTAGQSLSLLPILEHDTKVTHVILAALHLHEEPGLIKLNNEPPDADIYDDIWSEARILQENGIKVMGLLGGFAPGTYARLSRSDEEVTRYIQIIAARD